MSVNSSVQAQLQSLVQPRLDSFAERLGGIVAAAQSELRDLERLVEKSEARVENRLVGLEGRVAILADGAARTEQRERDLNTRIAGIAEGLLKSAEEAAFEAVEGGLEERSERLELVEERCWDCGGNVRRLEERLHDLEENTRSLPQLADELRSLVTPVAATAAMPVAEQLARLGALEEQVQALSHTLGSLAATRRFQAFSAIGQHVEAQNADVEVLASQLAETARELRAQVANQAECHEELQEVTRCCRSEQQVLTARLDDVTLRVGALKVKADGLEVRLHSGLERTERTDRARELEGVRWPTELEEKLLQHVTDHCNMIATDLQDRIENVEDACEETVGKALERRLATLSGELAPKAALTPRHKPASMRPRGFSQQRQ